MDNMLNISSSPHVRRPLTTRQIMLIVILALLPTTVVGVITHGLYSLWIILSAVISAVLTEFIFDKICRKPNTFLDGSAALTGLLLALTLSPSVPLYIPILGSVFAILVVKCFFGGLGKNFLNPALAARCFLLISFGKTMAQFSVDGVATATPVAELTAGRAVNITEMFLGTSNGVIGNSIVALLVGGLILWAMDIIRGEIWISIILSFTVIMGLFGGQGFDVNFLLAHVCGGGVVIGAFFMATDYVTSPVSRLGQTIYGILIGGLGALFRILGSAADSFSYAIIIGNLVVPLIDTYIIPKPYAFRKSQIKLQNGEKKKSLLKRIPKAVIVLTLVTLLAGVALSSIFTVTKDTIEAQKIAANTESYRAVLPEAESFESVRKADDAIEALAGGVYGTSFGKAYINSAVAGKNAAGETVGYVVSATSGDGYDGNITLSVGIKADGTITGIAFTELNETPGMGMRCDEPLFKDQFSNRNVTAFKVLKNGGSVNPDEIDAVSGATTSSRAVTNAVNAGLDFFRNYLAGGAEQ